MTATPQTRFEAEGFVLRPWEPRDAASMSEAVVDSYEHLCPWLDWASRDQDEAASAAVIDRFTAEWRAQTDFVLGIVSSDDRSALGGTGFHLRNMPLGDQAEIGMWIRADRAGTGLGTAALRAMLEWAFTGWGWRRIIWRCDLHNDGSRRVAEKCGMRLEGQFREDSRGRDGELRDTLLFASLAREHRLRDPSPDRAR